MLLIGVEAPYGLLVRGLDYPLHFRYAIFWGAPFFRISLEDIDNLSPKMLPTLAFAFRNKPEIEKELPYLKKRKVLAKKLKP
ncbi:MAG: hypothetical protein J7J32_00565 [Candidatus Atribacteria bacterium]|nr:hypothetical protein [Candidatus Atribacteria bacterium]MCD6349852.1 hypothetical protein [Candidatus Atribacteria bacterium]